MSGKKIMKKCFALLLALAAVLSMSLVFAGAAENGTYQVGVKIWHATEDRQSMAQVIGDTATVEKQDGTVTMTVSAKQMEVMGITGDLKALRVSDGKGGYQDAEVVSTNEKGLPTGFHFTVPESLYETGYIPVQEKAVTSVPVEAMEDWMDARIKVDLSTEKQTSAASQQTETTASSCPLSGLFSQLSSLL